MKTTEKDILRLCKGYYDYEKYQSLEEALDAYYRREYCVSKEEIPELSYQFMVELWFGPCVRAFVTPDNFRIFHQYVIFERSFQEVQSFHNEVHMDFYEVLYHRLVKWLNLLQVRDEKGNWIVDLSDYEGNVI